jgi:hypothetical protein
LSNRRGFSLQQLGCYKSGQEDAVGCRSKGQQGDMLLSRAGKNRDTKTPNNSLENVAQFRYLGTAVTNKKI